MNERNATTPTPDAPARGPGARWIAIALVISLAINLLIAGMVAGAYLRGGAFGVVAAKPGTRGQHASPLGDLGFGPFGRALSPAQKRELTGAIRRRERDIEVNRQEFRHQMITLLKALQARPYDAGAVRRIIEAQSRQLSERLNIGKELFLERIERMSDPERAAYARRLRQILTRASRARN